MDFFLFLWVIFALLDPDPCGSGSGYGSGSETLAAGIPQLLLLGPLYTFTSGAWELYVQQSLTRILFLSTSVGIRSV